MQAPTIAEDIWLALYLMRWWVDDFCKNGKMQHINKIDQHNHKQDAWHENHEIKQQLATYL